MLWKIVFALLRFALTFRYRIEVRGLDEVFAKVENGKRGVLFLPNHPGHMDPVIAFSLLWEKYRIRPLVVEHVYRLGFLKPVMKIIRALPVPSFDVSVNPMKVRRGEKSMQEIAAGLKRKENFILYPAGRLKMSGKEVIGGASGTHALIQECPDIDIVLMRITGLWGSMFSRAIEGRSPEFSVTIPRAFKIALKNLLFFMPRRPVVIEFEIAPKDFPRKGSRVEVNRYLENWYDQYPNEAGQRVGTEPLQLVSYSFWRKDDVPVPFEWKKKGSKVIGAPIPSLIRDKVYNEIRRIMDNNDLRIEDQMNLAYDIGMDSLNISEMIVFLSREYDIPEAYPEDMETVQAVLELAAGVRTSARPVQTTVKPQWPEENGRPAPAPPFGKTIAEAFLNNADRLTGFAACGDDVAGVLSYQKLKRTALVLAQYFKTIEEKQVAVLLPASVGAFVTILALQLAGKVPVMLNWTLGPRYLEEMVRSAGARVVLTSWRFIERLSHVDFGAVAEQLVYLEDVRKELTLRQKVAGAWISLKRAPGIVRAMGLGQIQEDDPAVILFTSGTEAVPKGVPLTHKNIISNLRSGIQCIDVQSDDIIYGVLPPFHSFGFSVVGLFPFFCGTRIAFYPDPTDSFSLAEGIERWKVTFFCSAPSFLKGLMAAAKPEQLTSVRYFVSGAERLAPELREKIIEVAPHSTVIEGYGITECSPILTISRPNYPHKGVGYPLPGVEICTIHLETQALLSPGSEGEICVRGPNVFHGYLGKPRDPFIEIEGKKWYRTGDIGRVDGDGSLILSGRLKRFTKIGGEMVSLGAIEEAISSELIRRGSLSSEAPGVALCCDEKVIGKPQLIIFTTAELQREEANEILKQAGFSRLIKIFAVKKIEKIPLMGTGKTDYRTLQSTIA